MDQPRLPPQIRAAIEEELQCVVTKEKQKYELEIDGLLGQKRTLEHKSEKLLEAHYNDAIPMGLLKAEQEKITKELAKLNRSVRANSEAAPAKIVTAKKTHPENTQVRSCCV